MSATTTKKESIHFLYFAIKRMWMAAGASEEHAHYVANGITFAHKQGKLNQGLGSYEAIDIALQMGMMDMQSKPEVIDQGPGWGVVDGHRSSGYYTLNIMADLAIEKARDTGIAIVFGCNHNDAGCFGSYVYKAFEHDMMGTASSNGPPLAAPFGGMENRLSCPPFDSIVPAGSKPPIWVGTAIGEFHDADVAEAAIFNKPIKGGKVLIDPETGELTDDVKPYAVPLEGYGRIYDCTAASQLKNPRTYAMNMWSEAMTSIINPRGIPVSSMPSLDEIMNTDIKSTSAGGSYFMCINPSVFGSLDAVKQRSDDYVESIETCPPRPGHSVRVPGSKGYKFIQQNDEIVEVMTNHWDPFFINIAGRYGLSEAQLREEFAADKTS